MTRSIDLCQLRSFAASLSAVGQHLSITGRSWAQVSLKDPDNEVTSVDLIIQQALCGRIRGQYPCHAVICEEEGEYLSDFPDPASARYCWVIDPLDGTRNFTRGLGCYCTAIGLLEEGVPVVGVIRNLVTGQMYTAAKKQGAETRGKPLSIAKPPDVDRRPIVSLQPAKDPKTGPQVISCIPRIHLRSFGSTALHLAMLADANLDGAVCIENYLWDVAGGALLVTEAGGIITDLQGDSLFPFDLSQNPRRRTPFIAASPQVHENLLQWLKN